MPLYLEMKKLRVEIGLLEGSCNRLRIRTGGILCRDIRLSSKAIHMFPYFARLTGNLSADGKKYKWASMAYTVYGDGTIESPISYVFRPPKTPIPLSSILSFVFHSL